VFKDVIIKQYLAKSGSTPTPTPIATPTPVPSVQYGACVIRSESTSLPAYAAANEGSVYVKRNIGNVTTFGSAQTACTDSVFLELMDVYCTANPKITSAQWGVAAYYSAGEPVNAISGCAITGCVSHTCPRPPLSLPAPLPVATPTPVTTTAPTPAATPVLSVSERAPASEPTPTLPPPVQYGSCVIFDGNLPAYSSADISVDHVKHNIGKVSALSKAKSECTDRIFSKLMLAYCALNPEATTMKWNIALYNSTDDLSAGVTTECPASGCEQHACVAQKKTSEKGMGCGIVNAKDSGKGGPGAPPLVLLTLPLLMIAYLKKTSLKLMAKNVV